MRSKLILCGLLPACLAACVTSSPQPLPVLIPASLTAPCQRPPLPQLVTNEDLAQAYLESLDSFASCSHRHQALVRAVQPASAPSK